jgi:UDP-glucose 4-epimerase/UDP-glucuronate decarboxylase
MKILITGGAGFIGFHLAKYLAVSNSDVTICDNFFRGKMDSDLKNLVQKENIKFVKCDMTNKKDLDRLEKDYDYVYHLAAINGTKYFYEIPHTVLRVNLVSLLNLLDWIIDTDCKRVMFLSSSEVYAGTPDKPIPTPEDVMLTINDVKNPRNSYAGSKITGELLCLNYARMEGLGITIIRPHNIYGPRMGFEHVIPELIMRILRKEDPFKIYGGDQTRAFCYIDDFVKGIELAAKSPKSKGEIFNIGNDREEISIVDLAKKMFKLFKFTPELKILEPPSGSVDRRCPNIDKAKRFLGYEPRIDLNYGLMKTYNWYSQQSWNIK